MADITYSSSNTITITLASLANAAWATSNAIDNSNVFKEAHVQLKIRTGASGVSSTGYFDVVLLASGDGGTSYADPASGVWLGRVSATANSTTYYGAFSTATFGVLPRNWKVAVYNGSGATTSGTAGDHACTYVGVK